MSAFCMLYLLVVFNLTIQGIRACSGNACENQTLYLKCDANHELNISTAAYGREKNEFNTCANTSLQEPSVKAFVIENNCVASNSFEKVLALCSGKTQCTIQANSEIFGEPCQGVPKYLKVEYTCKSYCLLKNQGKAEGHFFVHNDDTDFFIKKPADNVQGFERHHKKNYQGHELVSFLHSTIQSCATHCKSHVDCKAFVFNNIMSECLLKNQGKAEGHFFVHNDDTDFFIKKPADNVQGFERHHKKNYQGYELVSYPHSTIQSCATHCKSHVDCKAFAFNNKVSECLLKNQGKAEGHFFVDNDDTDFFIKKPADNVQGFERHHKKNYQGHELVSYPHSTIQSCATHCKSHVDCKAFVFNNKVSECLLKNQGKAEGHFFVDNDDTDFFIKKPADNVQGFESHHKKNYQGHELVSYPHSTIQSCATHCKSHVDCKAFVFNNIMSECLLKNQGKAEGHFFVHNDDTDFFIKKPADNVQGFERHHKKNYQGHELVSFLHSTIQSCATHCKSHVDCKAFVFNNIMSECLLKNQGKAEGHFFVHNDDTDFFIKKPADNVQGFERHHKKNYQGHELVSFLHSTIQSCATHCKSHVDCKAFVFNNIMSECLLKNQGKAEGHFFVDNNDTDFFIKKPADNVQGFERHHKKNYQGHELVSYPHSTIQSCATHCKSHVDCKAFVFNNIMSECLLKNQGKAEGHFFVHNDDTDFFIKKPADNVQGFERHHKKNYQGHELVSFLHSTIQSCATHCKSHVDCKAFVFNNIMSECLLKNQGKAEGHFFVDNDDTDFFIKKPADNVQGFERHHKKNYQGHELVSYPHSTIQSCATHCKNNVQGFERHHKKNYQGHELVSFLHSTIQSCATHCKSHVDCKAFVFNNIMSECLLKNQGKAEGHFFVHNDDTDFFIKKPADNVQGFERHHKKNYQGYELVSYPHSTIQSCATHCKSHVDCKAFAFNNKVSECLLKNQGKAEGHFFVDNDDTDFFIKKPADNVQGFERHHKKNYQGHELVSYPHSTIQSCATHCKSHNQGKAEGHFFVDNDDTDFFIKKPADNVQGFESHHKKIIKDMSLCHIHILQYNLVQLIVKNQGKAEGHFFVHNDDTDFFIKKPADNVQGFERHHKKNYQGHELVSFLHSTIQSCATHCKSHVDCKAFVFNNIMSECLLKNQGKAEGHFFVHNDDTDFFIKKPADNVQGFERHHKKNYQGMSLCHIHILQYNLVQLIVKNQGKAEGHFFVDNDDTDFFIKKPADNVQGFERHHKKNYQGHELVSYPHSTIQSCATHCKSHVDCKAFVFNNKVSECLLKNQGKAEGHFFVDNDDTDFFIKKPADNVQGFESHHKKNYQGHELVSYPHSTIQSCATHCKSHVDCKAFVFNNIMSECLLKNQGKAEGHFFVHNDDTDFFIKKPADNVQGFERHHKKNYQGHELVSFLHSTIQSCATHCKSHVDCKAFVFNNIMSECLLKNQGKAEGHFFVDNDDTDFFIKKPADNVQGFERHHKKNYQGHELVSYPHSTIQSCATHCKSHVDCKAFVFNNKVSECLLKNQGKAEGHFFVHNDDTDFFIKKPADNVQGFERHHKKNYQGYELVSYPHSTIQSCATHCKSHVDCKAFAFNNIMSECLLKNQGKAEGHFFVDNDDTDFFIKKPADNVQGFERHHKKNYQGHELVSFLHSTIQSCATHCKSHVDCKAFVFNNIMSECLLKNQGKAEGHLFVHNDDTDFFIKKPADNVQGFERHHKKNYQGYELVSYPHSTIQSCATHCKSHVDCKAFVFNNKVSECLLKNQGKAEGHFFVDNDDTDFFIKKPADNVQGFESHHKKNYQGHELVSYPHSTIQSCATHCKSHVDCKAFVFNNIMSECLLKNQGKAEGHFFVHNDDTDFFIKKPADNVQGFERHHKKNYQGHELVSFLHSTIQSCATHCKSHVDCKAFVFNNIMSECLLKNQGKAEGHFFVHNDDTDFFKKILMLMDLIDSVCVIIKDL
ncbi:DgyrCDS14473 [Dimorphilus gyrociliatus]|uniref:DgyrCDS14473 n=1 Tax=Dimorphilus gyrociliatus TaxID=2664684 RepID=A0A7I8WDX4_9ANNE|nr:DgyrCDS14473 [Dimorphilus gyrociliatus]